VSLAWRVRWRIRNAFWNVVAQARYRAIAPLPVKDVARLARRVPPLTSVPFQHVLPSVPITNVFVADCVPPGDRAPRQLVRAALTRLLMWVCAIFPPVQKGLPSIDADPRRALDFAYTPAHRRTVRRVARRLSVEERWALRPPVMPAELAGTPDLGGLAVRGPYAGYLRETGSREFEWDLRDLGRFEHRDGLYRLGIRVLFRASSGDRLLEPFRIESDELGTARPGDRAWPEAMRLAVCAASTHTSLVRHFNWIHLLGGEYLALVSRNHLPSNHPLCRFLWPHTFGTQQSNRLGSQIQLSPGGEFDVFSLTHRGVCDLFSESVQGFTMSRFDPYDDARSRGIAGSGIELPTESNMQRLFDVMLRHAVRYLDVYYATDESVRQDRAIAAWIEGMNALVPHGVSLAEGSLTKTALARLLARCIYMVTAYHELVGACLWNYQAWPGTHPIRVYCDGRREPLDVYQRLVNANYIINVIRAPLVDDFSALALGGPGHEATHPQAVAAFRAFKKDLEDLQASMDLEPDAVWRLHPMALEVNINA
jgi:arachidonate 15-lipoxygenase